MHATGRAHPKDARQLCHGRKPSSRVGAILIVSLWLAVGSALGFWLMASIPWVNTY